jgi:RND family efflux transporter MFP subunit
MKPLANSIARWPRRYFIIGGFVVLILIIGGIGFYFTHHTHASSRSARAMGQQVSVASVASLSPNNSPLSVIGSVESENEATILSETSGEITSLNVQLGNNVSAGDVIATLENSSEQAAIQQAQGAYDAAEATLANASGATAENSTINSGQEEQNLQNAQVAAAASLQSAYTALDDAIYTKADTLFNNPLTSNPTLIDLTVPDSQLVITVQNERVEIGATMSDADSIASDTVASDTDTNITNMIGNAQTVKTFLNDLLTIVNDAQPSGNYPVAAITGYQTSIGAAINETVGIISSLTTAKNNYDSASASAATATNSANSGTANDIAAAQASVEEELGALNAAKSALEKTIIRSPISGAIIDLPVTEGDYVSTGGEVAEISNPNALKVVVYITPEDAQTLAVGNQANINGTVSGVITQIAPAIDPETGAIEVDVGLPAGGVGLIDGDSVTVNLYRSAASLISNLSSSTPNIIPIVALNITPTGPVVFTVNTSTNTLVANPVQIGSILGDDIVVASGLTPNMVIVTDARGLTAGEDVSVAKP